MTKNKRNIKKKRRVIFLSLILVFAFACPFVVNDKPIVKAKNISTQSLNFVLPSVYYPCSSGIYTFYYTMPIYIGCTNGQLIVNYPRSGDGKQPYYFQTSVVPDIELTHIELGGLVAAVKSANNTYYGSFRNNVNVTCTLNIKTPSINDFDYSLDNPLFFNELQSKLNYINVQILGTTIYYSCYDFNDELIFYFTLTDLVPTSITSAFNQKFTPLFIQSTVNVNDYAQELIDLAFANGTISGYNQGYEDGYRDGVRDVGEGKIYTFNNLISAVINSPINAVKSIFDFDFLGVNLTSFILSLLTVLVVIKVVGMLI